MKEPKGKHVFGMVKVGEKGQIVIPKAAREIFDIRPGDSLLLLGDESSGLAIMRKDLTNDFILHVFGEENDKNGRNSNN